MLHCIYFTLHHGRFKFIHCVLIPIVLIENKRKAQKYKIERSQINARNSRKVYLIFYILWLFFEIVVP